MDPERQLLFVIAKRFKVLPTDPRLEELTVDQQEEYREWFDLEAKWNEEAREKARAEAEKNRKKR